MRKFLKISLFALLWAASCLFTVVVVDAVRGSKCTSVNKSHSAPKPEPKFKYGHRVVSDSTGLVGVIDTTGAWVIEPRYENISLTREYANVYGPGIHKLIGYDGTVINDMVIDELHNLMFVQEVFYQDSEEGDHWECESHENGYYAYVCGGMWGLMGPNHEILTAPMYEYIAAVDMTHVAALLPNEDRNFDVNSYILLDCPGQ